MLAAKFADRRPERIDATAEQRDDTIIRILPVGPELWVFKQTSIERWGPTGSGDETTAFGYIGGSLIPIGLKAFGLVTAIPSGAFFIGADGRAYLAAPGTLRPVSTVPVETALATSVPDRVFHCRYEGHEFCVIHFRDRPAWVLDVATGEWWERAQGDDLGPWQAVAAAECWGRSIVGTNDGRLLWLEQWPSDDDEPIHRRMQSITVVNDARRFKATKLELHSHVGRGTVDDFAARGPGGLKAKPSSVVAATDDAGLLVSEGAEKRTPQVLVRLSRDRGQTWGDWMPRSLGDIGRYETRLVWRALGQFETLTVQAQCSEPLDVTFDAAGFVEVA